MQLLSLNNRLWFINALVAEAVSGRSRRREGNKPTGTHSNDRGNNVNQQRGGTQMRLWCNRMGGEAAHIMYFSARLLSRL